MKSNFALNWAKTQCWKE